MRSLLRKVSFETLGLGLLLFFTLLAEVYRFKGYLLLDLWMPIFVGLWSLKALWNKEFPWKNLLFFPALIFLIVGVGSLLLHSWEMTLNETLSAFFYAIRWGASFGLFLMVSRLKEPQKQTILYLLFGFGLLLAVAGFLQLRLVPDFGLEYANLGWDPHRDRLLSTWFDPNFTGGGLVLVLSLLVGSMLDHKNQRWVLTPVALVLLLAIGLTYSRSAYLFLIASIGVIGLFRSWKSLLVVGLVGLLLFAASDRIQSRVLDMVSGAKSLVVETYTIPDPSARLRFASWDLGWKLFADQPLIGQGYNRYKYEALDQKAIFDLNAHAVTGSDSSVLTALATTGLLGTLPWLSLYFMLAWQSWRHRKNGLAVGFLGILCGFAIHSIFVNSLFFPPLMVLFWVSAGLVPGWRD